MPNQILTPNIIANEALTVFKKNLVAADLCYQSFSSAFAEVGDTVTVRKPSKFQAKNFSTQTHNQDMNEKGIDVKLDHYRDVSVPISSKELTLSIKDLSSQVVAPAMYALLDAVDTDILAEGIANAGATVKSTPGAKDLTDISNLAKPFDLYGAPTKDRSLILNTEHKYRYLGTDVMTKACYAGDSNGLREADLGKLYKFDTFMSQNAPGSLAAEKGTATAANVEGKADAVVVKLTKVTPTGGTFKKGEGIVVDGHLYRFTQDATASSGTIEEAHIDQNFHKTIEPEKAEAVYIVRENHSLAMHKNGIALVTRQLKLPLGANKAAVAVDPATGLSIRCVFDYDAQHKQDICSFDILFGVKTLDKNLTARLVG